jgi:UDP-N-acetylmuramyl pentapeptide phosphotransferase/UDP-N-acetylglucosamine-1-phosphate transferase
MNPTLLATVPLAACALTILLILALRPLLQRYALARPNARSSHKIPTPQGGGVAVVSATLATLLFSIWIGVTDTGLLPVFAAVAFIACVGAVDDLRPIPVSPRLLLQTVAVAAVLASLPENFRLFPFIPFWTERALLLIGGLWFVNLVNFMDGLDWITVAEIVPVTAALAFFGFFGQLPSGPALTALALCGAMVGFAPFNRPVAKLFLGDVGSLPIGLLCGWCLLQLAGAGHVTAALLLPLYYLADSTITLAMRFSKGEDVREAHRSHFYQRATDNGFSVMQIVTEIFILNLLLAALAALSIFAATPYVAAMCLAVGMGGVALVLSRFSRPREALP